MLPEGIGVDPGFVVEAVQVADRGEFEEIAVAGQVLCQKHNVVVACALAPRFCFLACFFEPAPFCHNVGFNADDRLDPGLRRVLVELDRPEEDAVVRQCDCRHAVRDCGMDQVLGAAGRIQKAVMRVIVQMDEL